MVVWHVVEISHPEPGLAHKSKSGRNRLQIPAQSPPHNNSTSATFLPHRQSQSETRINFQKDDQNSITKPSPLITPIVCPQTTANMPEKWGKWPVSFHASSRHSTSFFHNTIHFCGETSAAPSKDRPCRKLCTVMIFLNYIWLTAIQPSR